MELLTQDLPSGYNYQFPSLTIKPMFFAQILEYLENVPKNPIEKFYFDFKVVSGDDSKVEQLLLSDLDYVVFFKKGLTIADNLTFKTSAICPYCGAQIPLIFNLSQIKFNRLESELLSGINVPFSGDTELVRMPKVFEFLKIFQNYRRYKKVTDMRLIKLISLFEKSYSYQQIMEDRVINAKYQDISMLTMLDQLYFNTVQPISTNCKSCDELNKRGVEIGIDSLISDFFRDVIENNRLTGVEITPREVR